MRMVLTAAVMVMAVSSFAVAQSGAVAQGGLLKPDDVIAARQSGMALTGGLAAAMKAGVASGADVKPFTDGAEAMVDWAKQYVALYPDGTQTGHDTKAKASIWTDRAGFEKANAAYEAAAEQLAAAAKADDKQAFAAAFQTTTQACGGCHRNFKEK